MKNKISIILILLVGSMLMTSCFKEFLEPVPQTQISDLTAFDTKVRIEQQVNSLYAALKDDQANGRYLAGRYLVYNDIRDDDFINLTTNGVTGYLTWSHSETSEANEVNNLWIAGYLAINRVNVFMDGLSAKNPVATNIITEAEFQQYIGEAKAIRALVYFHLLQLYAQPYNKNNGTSLGLPLRLTAVRSSSGNALARSSVAEVYAQILQDLNDAEPIVAATHADDATNVTRFHKNSVIALKTRVYLHMSNYSAVLTEGAKIVSATAPYTASTGVGFALSNTFTNIFLPPYTQLESILSIPMTASDLPGTQNGLRTYYTTEYSINLAGIWGNTTAWPLADARRISITTGAGTLYKKFDANPETDWVPVMRYSEVLLNVAEAEARVNGVNAKALGLLNAVRTRSGSPAYLLTDFANVNAFLNALNDEKHIEFFGEGIRNMEIQRLLLPHPAKGSIGAVPTTAQLYIWPIPNREMASNSLMVQNL